MRCELFWAGSKTGFYHDDLNGSNLLSKLSRPFCDSIYDTAAVVNAHIHTALSHTLGYSSTDHIEYSCCVPLQDVPLLWYTLQPDIIVQLLWDQLLCGITLNILNTHSSICFGPGLSFSNIFHLNHLIYFNMIESIYSVTVSCSPVLCSTIGLTNRLWNEKAIYFQFSIYPKPENLQYLLHCIWHTI